jgi:hypothetical protein
MSFSLFMKKKNLEKNFVFSGDGWICLSSFSVIYLLAVPIKFPMNSQHVLFQILKVFFNMFPVPPHFVSYAFAHLCTLGTYVPT